MLNVSRPHVIELLDEGYIAYRMVGRHRRSWPSSLLACQRMQLGTSRANANDLAALTEDLGLYRRDLHRCFCDMNELYPNSLRDVLIWLAQTGLEHARWTDLILRRNV